MNLRYGRSDVRHNLVRHNLYSAGTMRAYEKALAVLGLSSLGLGLLASASLAQDAAPVEALDAKAGANSTDAKLVEVAAGGDIDNLSLEELMSLKVSTVSRQESTVRESPAAVFVITPEMIRRSGATTIMETLRMVPGLDVARGNGNTWAISARGFNGGLANKLLVQVDGRSVYTPVYSGVYWDAVDYPLEDIERIEVIRGPGATVWGANAVNGIINIITKKAQDTQGTLLSAGVGNQDRAFGTLRYGGKGGGLGDDKWYYRVYARGLTRDREFAADGNPHDAWKQQRGGFRIDQKKTERDSLTLSGNYFQSDAEARNIKPTLTPPFSFTNLDTERTTGGNIRFRWSREQSKERGWELDSYYDNFERKSDSRSLSFTANTLNLDFQQRLPLSSRQKFIYGLGYRMVDFTFQNSVPDNGLWLSFPRGQRTTHLFSAFAQDEIALSKDKLSLTIGSKIEHNSFTGVEVQPSGRLLWTPNKRQSAWAAISRAVRTPSFIESDINATLATGAIPPAIVILQLQGNPNFDSEELIAYELGYRIQPSDRLSLDTALFFNDYDKLSVVDFGTPVPGTIPGTIVFPILTTNRMKGHAYGFEMSANLKASERWRLYGAYSFLKMSLEADPTINPIFLPGADAAEGQSPRHQVYVRSSWDLPHNMEFDLMGRFVDKLPRFTPVVKSYVSLDARLAWKSSKNLEIAVVGQNLLDSHHQEFGGGAVPVEIRRGVYGKVTYQW